MYVPDIHDLALKKYPQGPTQWNICRIAKNAKEQKIPQIPPRSTIAERSWSATLVTNSTEPAAIADRSEGFPSVLFHFSFFIFLFQFSHSSFFCIFHFCVDDVVFRIVDRWQVTSVLFSLSLAPFTECASTLKITVGYTCTTTRELQTHCLV